jgi:hypothetical protein
MSQHTNQPNPGQSRELNLQTMAEQFMLGLQRHFDMLAYNLASREAVTEGSYVNHVRAPGFMPVGGAHSNFEQMQAYSRDLLFAQVVNDSLSLAVNCLHNVHFFLTLVKANKENNGLPPEVQQKAQATQQAFFQAPLDQKFNGLEKEYGVICELEDTIVALGMTMQALVQQGGVVREPQLDEHKELPIELKVAKEGSSPGDLWRQSGELETARVVFREGEKISFSDLEIQSILLTIAVFGHQLFLSVSNYARENQPGAGG